MTTITFGAGAVLAGRDETYHFGVKLDPVHTYANPILDNRTNRDTDYLNVSGTQVERKVRIEIAPALNSGNDFTITNLTPSVCTIGADQLVTTSVPSGAQTCRISVSNGRDEVCKVGSVYLSGAAQTNYFKTFIAGSLGKHITDKILALISGKTMSNAVCRMFSTNNYRTDTPSVVRSSANFGASLDMSGISAINGTTAVGGYVHPGMLVSPRHIITCSHFPTSPKLVFLNSAGVIETANIVSYSHSIGASLVQRGYTDITVGYLDRAITGCKLFKVLPSNWASYLPQSMTDSPPMYAERNAIPNRIPVLMKTVRNGLLGDLDAIHINELMMVDGGDKEVLLTGGAPIGQYDVTIGHESWRNNVYGGDSGSPVFFPVNNDLVLLGTFFGPGYFYHIGDFGPQINAAMNALATTAGDPNAGTYALQTANLSSFTAY